MKLFGIEKVPSVIFLYKCPKIRELFLREKNALEKFYCSYVMMEIFRFSKIRSGTFSWINVKTSTIRVFFHFRLNNFFPQYEKYFLTSTKKLRRIEGTLTGVLADTFSADIIFQDKECYTVNWWWPLLKNTVYITEHVNNFFLKLKLKNMRRNFIKKIIAPHWDSQCDWQHICSENLT